MPRRAIVLDIHPRELRRIVAPMDEGPTKAGGDDSLLAFVPAMFEGHRAFDEGRLDDARRSYERARLAARTPDHKVMALQRLGRVLERQAAYAEARVCYRTALALRARHPSLDDTTAARTHALAGWLEYRQARYGMARRHYNAAVELMRGHRDDWLLGNVQNGLGVLEKREDEFAVALGRFRAALDHWCRADYAYGVAAVYANIGTTYLRWGHHLGGAMPSAARSRYQRAVQWLERCLGFGADLHLGEDTSQAQAALAHAYIELGAADRAWPVAGVAYASALKSGNQFDLALAEEVLGRLHAHAGAYPRAQELLQDAAARFERLGHRDRAVLIRSRPVLTQRAENALSRGAKRS